MLFVPGIVIGTWDLCEEYKDPGPSGAYIWWKEKHL